MVVYDKVLDTPLLVFHGGLEKVSPFFITFLQKNLTICISFGKIWLFKGKIGGIKMKKTYLQEVTEIAKAFCKKYNYEFIFANESKFGYKDSNDQFWTLSYFELADILGNK